MESFQELALPEFLGRSLKHMNFVKPTPVQAQAIPPALEGKDVIASAQTGTGKTAAFGLPLLTYLEKSRDKSALVLTPTRELAMQVLEVLRKLTGTHNLGGSVLLIGGANMGSQLSALSRKPRLVIGTPGRVIDHLNRGSLSLGATGFLVLDEADRMLDMGFAPQLEEIRKRLGAQRQTLLFSATIPPDIKAMGAKYLKDPVRVAVGPEAQPVPQVIQKVLYTTEPKKPEELMEELKERQGSVLIFARTQHRVDRILTRLKDNGVKATRIHGGRTQSQRKQAIDQFREGKFLVLVATDIAARGLDILTIAHVINYDLPRNPEDYIHRIGRTARAGAMGESLCFLTPEDRDLWKSILKLMGANPQSIQVKPSRFGFTAPKPEAAPKPFQHAPRPHTQGQGHPGQGHPRPSNSPHPSNHRGEGGQRDFRPNPHPRHEKPFGDRHPADRHRQHTGGFGKNSAGHPFREGGHDRHSNRGNFIFHGSEDRQPGQNDSREWQPKKDNFLQRLGKKFTGGQHRTEHRDSFRDRQDFRRDNRPGEHRPHRFEHRSGEQKPFSREHRDRQDNRFGEQRHGNRPQEHRGGKPGQGGHRFGGDRPHRPGGGGFKRYGEGHSRPGGFRPR